MEVGINKKKIVFTNENDFSIGGYIPFLEEDTHYYRLKRLVFSIYIETIEILISTYDTKTIRTILEPEKTNITDIVIITNMYLNNTSIIKFLIPPKETLTVEIEYEISEEQIK